MKTFHCGNCGQQVFFENIRCERCEHTLGYLSEQLDMAAFDPVTEELHADVVDAAGTLHHEPEAGTIWRARQAGKPGGLFRKCRNYEHENVCNWMIPISRDDTLCRSCQLTSIIPALGRGRNREYWYKLELAKRRLLYTLGLLRLPIASRLVDPQEGLVFDFLEQLPGGEPVRTGHSSGRIVLNLSEADDAARERTRLRLGEPYRTLLGHFRHESGHYYLMKLVRSDLCIARYRALFGDERIDYAASLKRHYASGPPPDWQRSHVSAYATAHSWEDWAETWAHYLHMIDALETAESCGLALQPASAGEPEIAPRRLDLNTVSFDAMIERWFPLTYVLNSLNRSLGMPDGYPFSLPPAVIEKLRFVHEVVHAAEPAPLQAESAESAESVEHYPASTNL